MTEYKRVGENAGIRKTTIVQTAWLIWRKELILFIFAQLKWVYETNESQIDHLQDSKPISKNSNERHTENFSLTSYKLETCGWLQSNPPFEFQPQSQKTLKKSKNLLAEFDHNHPVMQQLPVKRKK